MNLGAWTCKRMRSLLEEDGRHGPNKVARTTGPGRLAWGLFCPNWVDSSPTCSPLHYVLVSSCSSRIQRPNSFDYSFLLSDEINASLLNFVSLLVFHGSCAFTYFLHNKVMLPSPLLVLYMYPRCFDDKAFPWCIIEHKVLNKSQILPFIMFWC
jgi:hypothetical protein